MKNNWISVQIKLPSINEMVDIKVNGNEVKNVEYHGNGVFCDDEDDYYLPQVTYWKHNYSI
jgi:hypothetical protein